MRTKRKCTIEGKSQKLKCIRAFDPLPFKKKRRVSMRNALPAEMHAGGFGCREPKTTFLGASIHVIDSLLQFSINCRDRITRHKYGEIIYVQASVYRGSNTISYIVNRDGEEVTLIVEPCGTPFSSGRLVERLFPTRTLKTRSLRNASINRGRRPLKPQRCSFSKIPYLQVISYAFSRSKNTATRCFRARKAS